jgi:prepilin-type N-terminal cleavage/methylation domain-containing protein
MKFNKKNLLERFGKIDVNAIEDKGLKAKALKLKLKQGGFTLLELLVVVAILAAIAGTASIALQDTDARAAAAAHVAMMDELNKGIRTYRVLNKNTLPNNYDSLLVSSATVTSAAVTGSVISIAAIDDVSPVALTADMVGVLDAGGITALQYVDATLASVDADGIATTTLCTDANLRAIVGSRANHYVAGNIFLTPSGNGCGTAHTLVAGDTAAFWTGGQERIIGQPTTLVEFDGTNLATATGKAFMAVGLGPASNLFNANELGGMTSVPVYRHVSATEYNRFIALFDLGSFDGSGSITASDQVVLAGVVDGAGDTKEEELGEWDGSRNTI